MRTTTSERIMIKKSTYFKIMRAASAILIAGSAACSGDTAFTGSSGANSSQGSDAEGSGAGGDGGENQNLDEVLANAASSLDEVTGDGKGENNEEIAEAGKFPSDPKKAAEALALACSKPGTKKHSQVITFAEPTVSCAWGTDATPVNGNLGMLNGRISARSEEPADLNLPPGALLCQMGLEFANGADGLGQTMYYDDEIFLTFNNLLLTASQSTRLATDFPKKDEFLVFTWDKLVSTPYIQSNGASSVYCAGQATQEGKCQIPATQTNGKIALTFNDSLVRRLAIATGLNFEKKAAALADAPKHQFKFITTGDNDDVIDCKHSTFQMTVNATYIVP